MVELSEATVVLDMVGAVLSFRLTVLFDCEVDAALSAPSTIAVEEDGTTVMVSLPLAVPDSDKPKVQTLPILLMLDGVALDSVAVPPLMDNVNAPKLLIAFKTLSEKVTAMVELSEATVVLDMVGAVLSFTLTVLFDCEVDAALSAPS